jgi:hypothetical protein
MGQNKLENQIREKLNSREIQPSAQAWDRLDAMLTVAEEKKTKRPYGWLYIAASVLVFATLGLFLFNQKETGIQPQNNVVGTEVKKDSTQKGQNKSETPIIGKSQENPVVVAADNKAINNQSSNNNQSVSIIARGVAEQLERSGKNQKPTNSNQSINQNQIIKDKPIEFQNSSDVAQKDLPKIIEAKPVIVDNRPKAKSDEQLLAGLDNVVKQTVTQKSIVKVDAKSLLSQVDGEVEYTFREKVINRISKNYKEVKVALANRNNE